MYSQVRYYNLFLGKEPMRRFFCFILSVILLGAPLHARDSGSIIAVINDKPIAKSDFNHRVRMALLSSGAEPSAQQHKELEQQILRLMIDEVLQQELGDKFKIDISETDIDRAIETIESQNNMPKGGLQKLFESNRIPIGIMRAHLKARQTWQEYIKAKYSDAVQISDQEVKSYLKSIKSQKDDPHYLLAEIYLPFSATGASEQEAQHYAYALTEKARKGIPFSALAQEFSQLPNASRGGDMGWITLTSLEPSAASAVKDLRIGDITPPIRVEGGYYLFLLRDKRSNGQDLGEDTLFTFQQALFPVSPKGSQEQLQDVYLKAQSFAQQARSCAVATRLISSQKHIKMQTMARVPGSQMPAELKHVLQSLKAQQPSQPILSEQGFLVFWLCTQEEYNPQDPSEDDVRMLLLDQRLSMLSQRELRNLHRGAVIDIRR